MSKIASIIAALSGALSANAFVITDVEFSTSQELWQEGIEIAFAGRGGGFFAIDGSPYFAAFGASDEEGFPGNVALSITEFFGGPLFVNLKVVFMPETGDILRDDIDLLPPGWTRTSDLTYDPQTESGSWLVTFDSSGAPVPDAGSTLGLFGLAAVAVAAVRRRT